VSRHRSASVLTVDDSPVVRADLRLILEDAGFEVCPAARDGVEAIDLAREHQPDLVLIDLNLPRVDGVEATRQILRERDVPVVALTGHRGGGLIERAIGAGAVAHILKPFHESQLVETVAGALASYVPRKLRDAQALAEADRRHERVTAEAMIEQGRSGRRRGPARPEADVGTAWDMQ
jgi:CheY-like chemotaxis protein